LTAEDAEWDFVLEYPNKWLTLVDYMTNPTKITPFMAGCAAEIVGGNTNERVEASLIITRDSSVFRTLPETQEFLLCLDANGTQFEDYALCGLPVSCYCMQPTVPVGGRMFCMNATSALFLQCSLSVDQMRPTIWQRSKLLPQEYVGVSD
jgi:hypothetical protein